MKSSANNLDLPLNDAGLSVTPEALNHVRRSLEKAKMAIRPDGIRVGVKKAGCSGYEYVIEYALPQNQKEFDLVFQFEGAKILIDKEIYLKFLKGGTVLDFQKEEMKEGLVFHNPNVANECGCGESFTLKDEVE